MKIYQVEIDVGDFSHKTFSILAKDFAEATTKAAKMLQKAKETYEDAEVFEVSYQDDVSEV